MTKSKHKLVILEAAQMELEEIAAMHKSLVGAASARKIVKRIYSALRHLRDHPQLGVALQERELARQGYRKLICGDYLCFYRVVGDAIHVYHVADGRSEYKRLFHSLPRDIPQ